MANLQTTVELIFQGIDRASDVATGVAGNLQKITSATESATAPLANFTKGVLATEAAVIAAGAALGIVAANEAQNFEIAFREIATLVKEPVENLATLRQGILDYAQGSTQGLDQINKAVYDAISAGVSWEDALQQVAAAEKAAIAGKADLADANRIILQATAAYAESNLDAAKASDILFTTVRTGVTTFPDLAQSIGGVISIAAQGGVSFEELNAAIATLTKTQGTDEAITALKGVITGIIAPSVEAKDAAKALGIEFSASSLKAEGLEGILRKVLDATGGNVDKISELFGNVRGLSGVLGLVTSDGARFKENLDAQRDALGATTAAYDKMKGVLDTGADALKVLAIQFGGPLLDAFYNSKAAITEITNIIADSVLDGGPLSGLSNTIKGYAEEIETAITAIWKNLPAALEQADFSGFENGLKALVDSIKKLIAGIFGDVDLTSVEGLAGGITNAGKAFELMSRYAGQALESFGPLLNKIGEFADIIINLDPALVSTAGGIGGVLTQVNLLAPSINTALLGFLAFNTQISAAATALGGGAGLIALLGKGGLVGAIGLLTFELTRLSGLDEVLGDILAPDWLAGEGATLGTVLFDIVEKLRQLRGEIPAQTETERLADFITALNPTASAGSAALSGWSLILQRITGIGEEADTAKPKLIDLGGRLKEIADPTNIEKFGDKFSDSVNESLDVYERWLDTLEKADANFATKTFEEIADEADALADHLANIKLQMPEIEAPPNIGELDFGITPEDFGIRDAFEDAASSVDVFGVALQNLKLGEDILNPQPVRDITQAFADGKQQAGDYALSLQNTDGSFKELEGNANDASSATGNFGTQIAKTEGVMTAAGKSAGELGGALDGVSTSYSQVGQGTVKATGAFKAQEVSTKDAKDALNDLTDAGKLTVDQLLKITEQANEFQVKMEEIASNERIKFIEAKVSLDIAALEADTKKVEAAFESITATIESTGDVLSGLYDNFAGAGNGWDQRKFEGWIEEENDRRDKAMEKQAELIDAQIDQIKAKTDALSRGDAMIKVSGDGLEPELEAFMWAILKRIQIEASADMQEFLLGIG